MKNMRRGMPSLFKSGTKHMSGTADAVIRNIEACKELSKMTRTSLGPNGMNKMVINHLDRLFVTSDAATILKETDVVHPAAKMMVMASNQQDYECGDGSNFVIVLAGELMAKAEALLRMGLHPADIVRGYRLAGTKAQEIIQTLNCKNKGENSPNTVDRLMAACYSAICSKQYGNEKVLCTLIATACASVMPKDKLNFSVDNVRVCKVLGGSLQQSEVVSGVVVARAPDGVIHRVENASVAVFIESIDASSTDTKGTVKINNARELLDYNLGEEQLMERTIKSIRDLGVTCVVSGGKISEMAMHFLEKFGIMAVRITSKFELRRIAVSLGAHLNLSINVPLTKEDLGFCSAAYLRDVGATPCTVFEQIGASGAAKSSKISTIILRGSTDNYLNDFERAINDGVNIVRAVCKDGRFVCGAGACEIELAAQLMEFSGSCSGLEQYAVKAYAESLEVFPRTLAHNAGLDSSQIVSKLYAEHERGTSSIGIDIEGSETCDVVDKGIIDHLETKAHALKLATDVATTILQVDQIIMAKPAGGPKAPKGQGHWDEQED